MSPGALAFLLLSWAAVLGLTGWAFARVLRAQRDKAGREAGREAERDATGERER